MTRDEAIATLRAALGDRVRRWERPSETRVYLEVFPTDLPESARVLFEILHARLQTATGVDGPREIEIMYHWALDGCGAMVSVRTRVDRGQPALASITSICPAAEWIEREIHELLGVVFRGHPDPRHLLLSDDWPAGRYPLRRDYRKGDT